MCGVVGWVDFDRDLSAEHPTIRAMTATMALRGPDAEGTWLGRHAALGHRRLAVIDLAGGAQPMAAEEDGAPVAVLTYSGEVYNYRELREELRGYGHTFRTASDTEVVLRAYLQWGDACAERLNGIFAFGLWDARRQRLLLVRDRMGIKPLYYYPTPRGVLFASEPKGIFAHPWVTPAVDQDGLRELLSWVKTPGHGLYRGMFEVKPGHTVVVDRGGVHPQRYWQLETREHTDDLPTTIRAIRELLDDIITRQMISDVPLCTLLSGGLDSSAVTALAAGVLGDGGPVRSFSVDFAGLTDNFQPDVDRGTPDTPFARELAGHVKAEHRNIVLDNAMMTDPLYRLGVLTANDKPVRLTDMHVSVYLLFSVIRQHSTVALSGESADELFGGYRWFHDGTAEKARTFPWLAAMPRRADGTEGNNELIHPDLVGALDVDAYREAHYQQALGEVGRLPGEDPHERGMREVLYLGMTRFLQILLDRKDRMSMAYGLEVRVPFCDHRLVEYVYNTPWAMKTFDGREKSLLRAAVADLLPPSVVRRNKSPYPSPQDPRYEQVLRARLAQVVESPGSLTAQLLNLTRLRELVNEPLDSNGFGPHRRAVESVLSIDDWLNRYPVHLAL